MALWEQFVELLREAIYAYAQASHGNLATGILGVTFLARLALFPLTLRLAKIAATHQDRVRQIQPELDALRVRHKHDPRRLAEETRRVFSREGISMFPMGSLVGGLVQAPILLGLYSAVRQCASAGGRFLWVADISKPDRLVVVLVAALTGASAALAPQATGQSRTVMTVLPALLTMLFLAKMAAGVGLYWGVSSAVGVVQAAVAQRGRIRATA